MLKYEFIAVDFDGTLCTNAFPEIGEPRRAVIDYVKTQALRGSKIILYTSRENGTRRLLDEAVEFCRAQEIPLYAVNENPGNPYAAIGLTPSDNRKVYADLYIDDKALNPADIAERTGPLTIEELRQMDGEPVWCLDFEAWGIVEVDEAGGWAGIPFISGKSRGGAKFVANVEERGLTLLRWKPEWGECHA